MRYGLIGVGVLAIGCGFRPPRPLAEALQGSCGGNLPKAGTATQFDLKAVTVADASGRCNDGSPPKMFVRRGTQEHADDWIIDFEGGGFCEDYDTCRERYCGVGAFDATRMSTRYDPPTQRGVGILDQRPDNAFADWNVVKLRYCTSDIWIGNAQRPVTLSGRFVGGFTLTFEGLEVVKSMLARLDAGTTSDDGSVRLPKLSGARRIIVVGESAGAAGAVQHLDRIAGRYPEAKVWGVIDGTLAPSSRFLPEAQQGPARQRLATFGEHVFAGLWNARADQNCDSSDCFLLDELVPSRNVRTPMVVRQDQLDPVVGRISLDLGIPRAQYPVLVDKTLNWFAEQRKDSSFLGTRCGTHIVATADTYYTLGARNDGQGQSWTLHEVVEDLVLRDQRHVALETVGYEPLSSCPPGGKVRGF